MTSDKDIARRSLALVDLTDLSDTCDAQAIAQLTARALALPIPVAALCFWPAFVRQARELLHGSPISLATVVNFPQGLEAIEAVRAQTIRALADGADEIDLVLPWQAFLAGHTDQARDMVVAIAASLTPGARLKVILETGELGSAEAIGDASKLAIEAGAHFLKTSTGKTPVSATPEAARIMLQTIRESGRQVGFKVSGGLRTLEQARLYLDLADGIMGADWARKETFRFGASSLIDPLVQALDGQS